MTEKILNGREKDSGLDFESEEGESEVERESPEIQEQQEDSGPEINTLHDFMEHLKHVYDSTGDRELRQNIAHHLIKLEIALSSANLTSVEVMVRPTDDHVLGFFDPENRELVIAQDVVEDFETDQKLLKTILVHEKGHKEDGIADEGLNQKLTERRIASAPGIYEKEKDDAESAFSHIGIDKALELYEMDKPEELTMYYLEKECELLWKTKSVTELKKLLRDEDSETALEKFFRPDIEQLQQDFKTGVPRLYEELEKKGFDFENSALELLKKIGQDSEMVIE